MKNRKYTKVRVKGHLRKLPKQTGTRKSIHADKMRKAKPIGWRKSKRKKWYYESRKNRSDNPLNWL